MLLHLDGLKYLEAIYNTALNNVGIGTSVPRFNLRTWCNWNLINITSCKWNPLHLLGLVSDGGVHAHTSHLKAICAICKAEGLEKVFIHAFTDGRDTDPKSGLAYVTDVEKALASSVGKIATVSGRYYAMDRDKRWERVQLAYDALSEWHWRNC